MGSDMRSRIEGFDDGGDLCEKVIRREVRKINLTTMAVDRYFRELTPG